MARGRSTLEERGDVQHLVLLNTEFGGAGGGFGRHSDDVAQGVCGEQFGKSEDCV